MKIDVLENDADCWEPDDWDRLVILDEPDIHWLAGDPVDEVLPIDEIFRQSSSAVVPAPACASKSAHHGETFADLAYVYLEAGWEPIPLAAGAKGPPPRDSTGHGGTVTRDKLHRWVVDRPDDDLAVRMPEDVVGIDLDTYKGGCTIETLEDSLGGLPSTHRTSARDDGSGIRYFRVPIGTKLSGVLPGDVAGELIQRHHRYAKVSGTHPNGGRYRWISPEGTEGGTPPRVTELAELSLDWIEALSKSVPQALPRLQGTVPAGMSRWVAQVAQAALQDLSGSGSGSRHDATLRRVMQLTWAEAKQISGAAGAIGTLRTAFIAAVSDRSSQLEAEREFDRMLKGGHAKLNPDGPNHLMTEGSQPGAGSTSVTSGMAPAYERFVQQIHVGEEIHTLRPPEQLIPGLCLPIPLGGLGVIAGNRGSLKSFTLSVDLALRLAVGQDLDGNTTMAPRQCLVIAAEGGGGMRSRLEAAQLRRGFRKLPDTLHLLLGSPKLTSPSDLGFLVKYVQEQSIDVVVIDTIRRTFAGNENDASDAGVYIDGCIALQQARPGDPVTVLPIGHTPKNGGSTRGSSVFEDDVDFVAYANRDKSVPSPGHRVNLHIEKNKDGPDGYKVQIDLSEVDVSLDGVPDLVRTLVVESWTAITGGQTDASTTNDQIDQLHFAVVGELKEAGIDGITKNALSERLRASKLKFSNAKLTATLNELASDGAARCVEGEGTSKPWILLEDPDSGEPTEWRADALTLPQP